MTSALRPGVNEFAPVERVSHPVDVGERFTSFYEEQVAFAWRTLLRFGVPRDEVDDCCQEVFVIVHRKLDEFDGEHPRAWVAAIARRVASDFRRGAARKPAARALAQELTELPAALSTRGSAHDERLAAASTLQLLLEELDADSRELFVLAELEGLGIAEAAEVLNMNANTAYSKLRVTRRKLRARYAGLAAQDRWRTR